MGYRLIRPASERLPQFRAATWHAAVLAVWSTLDAIGWMRIQQAAGIARELVAERRAAFDVAGYVIIGASIICPLVWMLMVRRPPNWERVTPVGTREQVRQSIQEIGELFDRRADGLGEK